MGRVSCNIERGKISDKVLGFVPCGACELQSDADSIRKLLSDLCFVPCGACELQLLG